MPESQNAPGTYWAFPDSPDRAELFRRARVGEIQAYVGRATLLDDTKVNWEIFTPVGLNSEELHGRLDILCPEAGVSWGFVEPVLPNWLSYCE